MKITGCLLFILLQSSCFFAFSQKQPIRFEHLGTNTGLSQSNVTCILQDSRGFMWFGTQDGLNKYDGYQFTVYKNNPSNPNSISHNYIKSIVEDAAGNLWIATWGGGLNRFNRNKENFTHYKHNSVNANTIADDFINCLLQDANGNLWLGTQTGGLNMLNPNTSAVKHYTFEKNNPASLSDNFVVTVFEDSRKQLWAGTLNNGLNLLNKTTGTFTRFTHKPGNVNSLSNNSVCTIFEDSRYRLWIGTRGGGLDMLDHKTTSFQHYKNNPGNNNSLPINVVFSLAEDDAGNLWIGTENGGLSILHLPTNRFDNYFHDDVDVQSLTNNSIYSVYKDRQGNMWVGTFSGGINLYTKSYHPFAHYRHTSSANSLSHNNVLGICESADGNIWLGTDGGGANRFNPHTRQFTHYKHRRGNRNSICSNVVIALTEDSERNIWMGTCEGGVTVFNERKNTFTHFKHNAADANSLASNNVCALIQDADNEMWLGTYGAGLDRYNIKTGRFTHYRHSSANSNSLSNDRIQSLLQDSKGYLWIGTFEAGINRLDKKTGTIIRYQHTDASNSLSDDHINFLYEDKQGNIWIGTHGGLNCLNPTTNRFTVYTTPDGLPGNIVYGITGDDRHNLWVSTNNGLCRFNPITKSCKNFSVADGLQSNEFKSLSALKSRPGRLYFGGVNGFNEFFPGSILKDPYEPPLVITGFQLFNKDVPVADSTTTSPLVKPIGETKAITLPHNSSVISFEFASLNYTGDEKKQYAYRLKGFDKNWNFIGTRHATTYTNLDPGKYVFEVKGMNNEGEWSTRTATLQLTILPPFWMTWWFITLTCVIIFGTIFILYWRHIHHIEKQNIALEKVVKQRTLQLAQSIDEERKAREDTEKARSEAEQANKAKSIFLATMSHEIRTPMNGVIGMASLLSQTQLNSEQRSYTETIQTCGENLLTVINDILDFSKIESGKMELEEKEFNLRTCIEEVLDIFAPKAAQTGIDLVYQIEYNVPQYITGDNTRLRQILMNLVGNAIKFTHTGEVFVRVYLMNDKNNTVQLGFEVRDTGIGIPADKMERLFKAFSQVDSSTTRKYGGTGLGLVICEKLIQLMGGYIEVESKPGQGSVFAFTINTKAPANQVPECNTIARLKDIEGRRVLIVDDNETNRKILKLQLEQWNLQPVMAASGKQALDLLTEGRPFDLVLTDMHMPGMNGVELAKNIRSLYPGLSMMLLSSVGDDLCRQHNDLFNSVLTKPVKQQTLCKYILSNFRAPVNTMAEKEPSPDHSLSTEFADQYPLEILLAEDNPFNQALATAILGKLGYRYDTAENGEEVLNRLSEKVYDVILMDIQMPEMDGLEATRLIRKQHTNRQPVIIAMTANAMHEDREECIAAGMNDYLSKPIKPGDVVTILKKWAG